MSETGRSSDTADRAADRSGERSSGPRPKSGAPLLPPSPRSDRPLFFVVAIIVALACAAAISARAAWSASNAWTAALEGAMTVNLAPPAIGPGDDEDWDAVAAAERAAVVLSEAPGVASARALSRDELADLLAPYFDDVDEAPAALVPGVVDVNLDPTEPAQAEDLRAALTAAGIEAQVDDHGGWTRDVRRAAGAARTLALGAFTALMLAAAAVTSFATRASLSARADVVEVLHMVGARDDFIASEFTRRFLGLGVRAGSVGAVIAVAAGGAAMLLTRGGSEDFLPSFAFARVDAAILALAPLASATVAAFTARETVLSALRRMY
ncbi:MAG: hypothetical protein PVI23_14430 [Maricaulaceae bacterium]|jgi:cell division transport system permease protein